MKLIHLSDLHLGKRVNEFSMLEDQKYILQEILGVIDQEQPEGVIIAGDVYDKANPSGEAVDLFDKFLVQLAGRRLQVFVISGNHDSSVHLAFGNRLMEGSGIHISPVYNGWVEPISLQDAYGEVKLYMLPFVKPAHVRPFFPEEDIGSYTDALRVAVEQMQVDVTGRNVLITHQFVTGATKSDSEEISVGGTDNVDGSVFEDFDYVALGHIHGPQNVGSEHIRYCGTPLKYSFSEVKQEKSVTVVELLEKGKVTVRQVPLTPLRDWAELRGTYDRVTLKGFYEGTEYPNSYLRITLTDEEDVPDAQGKLRLIYPYLMNLDYDNTRTRHSSVVTAAENVEKKSPMELFGEFYALQNGSELTEEQRAFMLGLIEEVWEEKP